MDVYTSIDGILYMYIYIHIYIYVYACGQHELYGSKHWVGRFPNRYAIAAVIPWLRTHRHHVGTRQGKPNQNLSFGIVAEASPLHYCNRRKKILKR